MIRTQVAIVGAGPAGLILGHLLHLYGVDSIIVENRSREYVIDRVRAGVLEQHVVDMMIETGCGERLQREGMRHKGVWLAFSGSRRRIDFAELTGKAITVYGQNEVVKDLIEARLKTGRPLLFEVENVAVLDFDSTSPRVRFRHGGGEHELACDFIAGCDGFHGICRSAFPHRIYERVYPFAWLGILARAAPSSDELIYSLHERGFALFSMPHPRSLAGGRSAMGQPKRTRPWTRGVQQWELDLAEATAKRWDKTEPDELAAELARHVLRLKRRAPDGYPELAGFPDDGPQPQSCELDPQSAEHWREVLPPGALLDVRYEDLIRDNEARKSDEF